MAGNEHANIKISDFYLVNLICRTTTHLVIDSGYVCPK